MAEQPSERPSGSKDEGETINKEGDVQEEKSQDKEQAAPADAKSVPEEEAA